ncbi:hypothetical protein [Catellatospora methionotrophica]|uniref:hypothetical protein n=1 Tax=Catellatospora methionotrophica TaxID=121620 RepID=UPI0033C3A563
MSRTWPSPAIRLIRCGVVGLTYLLVAVAALSGLIEDAGSVASTIVTWLASAAGVLILQASWHEPLVLTRDGIIVGNSRREIVFAQVAQATADPDGVYLRLRDGGVVFAAVGLRLRVDRRRHRHRRIEQATRLINDKVTRHDLMRRVAEGLGAVQQVRSGR